MPDRGSLDAFLAMRPYPRKSPQDSQPTQEAALTTGDPSTATPANFCSTKPGCRTRRMPIRRGTRCGHVSVDGLSFSGQGASHRARNPVRRRRGPARQPLKFPLEFARRARQVSRNIDHYNLRRNSGGGLPRCAPRPAVPSSAAGPPNAYERVSGLKGFTLDDERLKIRRWLVLACRIASMNYWNASATSEPASAGCTCACARFLPWPQTILHRLPQTIFPIHPEQSCSLRP